MTPPPRRPAGPTLPARLVRAFLWRFSYVYGYLLFWRLLDGVYVRGLWRVRELARERPIILAANHTSWWDGIFTLMLHHWLRVDGRFLVARDSAESTGVISTFGGIGVDTSTLAGITEAMQKAAEHLDGPRRSVLIFPQGRFRAPGLRPLGLQRGVKLLQRWSDATIVPVSITMAHLDTHLPAAILTLGEPIEPGRRDVMEVLEQRLVEGLDDHQAWIDDLSRPERYERMAASAVVPIERRPGALIWTGLREVLAWIGRLAGGPGGRR